MNRLNLLSPDFVSGKILVTAKAIADLIILWARSPSKKTLRLARMILKVKPRFTMVKNKNLINLYNLVQEANRLNVPGDIVECGVWNGGSAAVMGVACVEGQHARGRAIWLFDSFAGLPRPGERDADGEREVYFEGWNKGDIAKVKQIFEKLGLGLENVHIVPGWFEQTLATTPVRTIALLHIDADWYNSVKTALVGLYDRVVPGGFIILDDYGYWQGCTQALHDFFSEHGIERTAIKQMSRGGAYFQKALSAELKPVAIGKRE